MRLRSDSDSVRPATEHATRRHAARSRSNVPATPSAPAKASRWPFALNARSMTKPRSSATSVPSRTPLAKSQSSMLPWSVAAASVRSFGLERRRATLAAARRFGYESLVGLAERERSLRKGVPHDRQGGARPPDRACRRGQDRDRASAGPRPGCDRPTALHQGGARFIPWFCTSSPTSG
jgi:hypothetical protein